MDDCGRTIVNLALARHGEAGIVRFSAVFRNDHNCLGNLLVRRAEGSRDAAGGGADRHASVMIAGLGRNRALREIFSVDGSLLQTPETGSLPDLRHTSAVSMLSGTVNPGSLKLSWTRVMIFRQMRLW